MDRVFTVTATYWMQICALIEENHVVPKGKTKMECGEFIGSTKEG
jgi:hypothetical protein